MVAIISHDVRGLETFSDFISTFARQYRGMVTETIADDLIGTSQRGLRHYPAYKHVRRRSVYNPPFKSDRQRRFVMARIREGRIDPGVPHRTGRYQRSWKRVGSGVNSRIEGELPHGSFPDRLSARVGWRNPQEIVDSNVQHAITAAERAVQKMINEKGYG